VRAAFSARHPAIPAYEWFATAAVKGEVLSVTGRIFEGGTQIGHFSRRLMYAKGVGQAIHEIMEIERRHRDKDIAKHHYGRALAFYQREWDVNPLPSPSSLLAPRVVDINTDEEPELGQLAIYELADRAGEPLPMSLDLRNELQATYLRNRGIIKASIDDYKKARPQVCRRPTPPAP
jgi:hypothetical protein